MIPKVIHYCWFGRGEKPKLFKKCLKSWKKYCPDYEIIEWNEDNFDINSNLYVRQAYENRKFAFVTDYVRLYVIYTYGGIYMDTDVEVTKNLDAFLSEQAFSGFENDTEIPTGIMAGEKGLSVFADLLTYYDNRPFITAEGKMDITTNVIIITEMLSKKGFEPNGKYQVVDGFALYPKDYFCPKDYNGGEINITQNTAAIHHFDGSWQPSESRKSSKRRYRKRKLANIKYWWKYLPNRILIKVLGEKNYEKLKAKMKG